MCDVIKNSGILGLVELERKIPRLGAKKAHKSVWMVPLTFESTNLCTAAHMKGQGHPRSPGHKIQITYFGLNALQYMLLGQ